MLATILISLVSVMAGIGMAISFVYMTLPFQGTKEKLLGKLWFAGFVLAYIILMLLLV